MSYAKMIMWKTTKKLPQYNQGNNQRFICGSIKETIKGLMQRMSPILMT